MADIRQSIPFIPQDATWDSWNGNLLHYFGQEPLPIVDEENWRSLANHMLTLPTFNSYALPAPEGFINWQDWVSVVVIAINGPTQ
jgi:hypothetical protein